MKRMTKYVLFLSSVIVGIGIGAYQASANTSKPEGVMGSNVPESLVKSASLLSKSATNRDNSIPDLSEFQGSFTDAQAKVLKKNFKFIILRVQYGSNRKDLVIDHNIAMMKKYNIPYGVYSFSQYENVADARVEAKDLYNRAKDAKFFVNDYEDQTVTNASKANTNATTKAWADEMAKYVGNRKIILYSYASFMKTYASTAVNAYDGFWLAAYQSNEPMETSHSLWQYTSNFTNHGLSGVGNIDASIMSGKNADWFLSTSTTNKLTESTPPTNAAGKAQSYNELVSIKKSGYNVWGNFSWNKVKSTTTGKIGKVYSAKYYYNHSNGNKYYSLYDSKGKWAGYVNSNAMEVASAKEFKATAKITKRDYTIWSNFFYTSAKGTTANYYGQNLNVRYRYTLGNGNVYYSLYNNAGTWLGYMNSNASNLVYSSYDKIVSVKNSYTIWGNFNWTSKKGSTVTNSGQTYNAKYAYKINGNTYYSLYNANNVWKGYVNSNATNTLVAKSLKAKVKISDKGYNVWGNFLWSSKKGTSSNYYGQTYNVRYRYTTGNGNIYYSLYNDAGKWMGYVNNKATSHIYTKYNKIVSVKRSYDIWGNFNWTVKKGSTIANSGTKYTVKYAYSINGNKYYSIYNANGKWQGYVNSNAF